MTTERTDYGRSYDYYDDEDLSPPEETPKGRSLLESFLEKYPQDQDGNYTDQAGNQISSKDLAAEFLKSRFDHHTTSYSDGPPTAADLHHAFHDPGTQPQTTPNRFTSNEFWQREWGPLYRENKDGSKDGLDYQAYSANTYEPGPVKAMALARDAGNPALHAVAIYRARPDWMDDPEQNTQYGQAFGPDWHTAHQAAGDTLQSHAEFAMHLTALGLLRDDQQLTHRGQEILAETRQTADLMKENASFSAEYASSLGDPAADWPATGGDPAGLAQTRHQQITDQAAALSAGDPAIEEEATRFLARYWATSDADRLSDRATGLYHEAGGMDSGIPSSLRDLSDQLFAARYGSTDRTPVSEAAEALATGDTDAAAAAYGRLAHLDETMLALAFANYHGTLNFNPPEGPTLHQARQDGASPAELRDAVTAHLTWRGNPNPDTPLEQGLKDMTDTHLARALDAVNPDAQSAEDQPHQLAHHYSTGAALNAMASAPGFPEEAVTSAQAHPEWHHFLAGRTRYQWRPS